MTSKYPRQVVFRIEQEKYDELQDLAESLGHTPTSLVRSWVYQGLQRTEDPRKQSKEALQLEIPKDGRSRRSVNRSKSKKKKGR